jgi:LemA protein
MGTFAQVTVLVVIVSVVVLALVWLVATYNRLVRLRNKREEAWSGIDVQLQRRAELVPNLVATVRGYADHEEQVLAEVTEARASMVEASGPRASGTADDRLEAALGRLFAVAEAYPELRAAENFLALQRELVELEEEISFARRYHNATVEDLNTRIQTFPTLLVARPLGFRPAEYFKAEGDARTRPDVELGR